MIKKIPQTEKQNRKRKENPISPGGK